MNVISFEYTDQSYTFKLIGSCILSFVLSLIILFSMNIAGPFLAIGVAATLSILVFWINKKKIKKLGTVSINETMAGFQLPDGLVKIDYSEIKNYKLSRYKSSAMTVKRKVGPSFILYANSNFCNTAQFDAVCVAFDKSVQQYKVKYGADLNRLKAFF